MPRSSVKEREPATVAAAIGTRLREERLRLGLTQEALAEHFDVRRLAVIAYEAGERSPGADQLAALEELGADAAYVLTGRRREEVGFPDRADLLAAMAAVDDLCRSRASELDGVARLKLALEMVDALYRTRKSESG